MTRCDYDVVFYRVFCITLLAIAFTFIVILTNVFIDIDGLIANKKDKLNARPSDNTIRNKFTSEATGNDEMNYDESDDSYRTKRSIETQSFLIHIKNPKFKNILANRLSSLLTELDAEESSDMKPKEKKINKVIPKDDVEVVDKPKLLKEDKKEKGDDLFRLSMHNILLQGMLKQMNFNDVYKRVYSLMNFNEYRDRKDGSKPKPEETRKEVEEPRTEGRLINKMLNYNELQEQTEQITTVKAPVNVVIKTVLNITSTGNDKLKENDTKISKENIIGDIELVYNGKVMKFTHPDAEMAQPTPRKKAPVVIEPKKVNIEANTTKITNDYSLIPKSHINKFVEEYFKRFPRIKDTNNEIKEHFETKRLKRNVKIKIKNDSGKKKKVKKNTEEDELFVEIETHIDSKGMKGEKKKKLIKNLIEKIQKAIHSDTPDKKISKGKNNTKQHSQIHFRKRLQNPLEHDNHVLINKNSLPITNIIHRQLNPISKTISIEQNLPYINTKSEEEWKKPFIGPGFLADTKALNSAEMNEVNVDYSKILEVNGIPQRLQQPLNAELSEETINTNSYYDMGKIKFYIKNIDGSGFSVGFNQYVDEPPDPEAMRLFTGLENIIKTYHQTYDPAIVPVLPSEADLHTEDGPFENPPNDEHTIKRRSINKIPDDHSNEYRNNYDKDFLPFKSYHDIFGTEKNRPNLIPNEYLKKFSLIIDENIFDKNLNPSEIFGLANLLERKKRSVNVKKISNLKTKIKLNKYLNSKATSTKAIFLNKKRDKRQINKIRIIASDLPHLSKYSDDNVFFVSNENVFADRAIVRGIETSDGDHDKQDDTDHLPYEQDDVPGTYISKIFNKGSRQNSLMTKYPHILMEEISRSQEQYIPNNALLFENIEHQNREDENTEDKIGVKHVMTSSLNDTEALNELKEQGILDVIMAPPPRTNYKVNVKIIPKNQTDVNSGFKEIHTSVNKQFNKNGLLYSSLVNVSEISKIINLNASKDRKEDLEYKETKPFLTKKLHDQQKKLQTLLKQHAKHINEQLTRLQEEKIHLESILEGNNNTDIRHSDYGKISASVIDLKLANNKDKVSTAAGEATKDNTINVTIKPIKDLPTSTIQTRILASPTYPEKIAIERTGNLTDQILKKIDENTEMLQMFLSKLTERLETISTSTATLEKRIKNDNPEWVNQGMPFIQNMVIKKNDSLISIPSNYQPPTTVPHKSITHLADVIYQGHIVHTLHTKDMPPAAEKVNGKIPVKKIPESNNQSRFFIDELGNDYKVIQVGNVKKNRDYNMVSGNGTLS